MIHTLKCNAEFFDAIVDERKTFEARRNDRNYKIGDRLKLQRWIYEDGELIPDPYIGDIHVEVTYLLSGEEYGIRSGFVVMGIKRIYPKGS